MFTGIIQGKGQIISLSHQANLIQYEIRFPASLLNGLVVGASVSVQGICQTVIAIQNNIVCFEAIQETIACTTVSSWQRNDSVNIERSLKMGDEIGGHLLNGHIIGVGTIQHIGSPSEEQSILTIECNPAWVKYLFPKGYIALNGASLTIGKVDRTANQFTVNLIPETRKITTFGNAFTGDKINIEIDSQTLTIVETVERILFPV
jgi:riboflavin synthase